MRMEILVKMGGTVELRGEESQGEIQPRGAARRKTLGVFASRVDQRLATDSGSHEFYLRRMYRPQGRKRSMSPEGM